MFSPQYGAALLRNFHRSFVKGPHKKFTLNSFEVKKLSRRDFKPNDKSWFSKRSILTRWSPIVIVSYGCYAWNKGITEDVSSVEIEFYTMLPLRIVSKIFGVVADIKIPTSKRNYVFNKYSSLFNVNLDEAITSDLTDYESLGEFFTRGLKPEVRIIDKNGSLVSPCDGKLLHYGAVTSGKVEQVKGVTYNLEDFLGRNTWSRRVISQANNVASKSALMEGFSDDKSNRREPFAKDSKRFKNDEYYKSVLTNPDKNCLYQCVIYLAPGDYHRFHSPCDWVMRFRRHFCGKLLSVNPIVARLIPGLFCLNERAVYVGEWAHGFFSYTAVGATNVGSIRVYKDEALRTNGRKSPTCDEVVMEPGVDYERGEIMGQFNLGSTVVLIFEAPKEDFDFVISKESPVRMGMEIASAKFPPKKRTWWFFRT